MGNGKTSGLQDSQTVGVSDKIKFGLENVASVDITRSYARKIKFGDQYEMCDQFYSISLHLKPETTIKDIEKISEDLYQTCREDVEYKVVELQNPQKAVRGFLAISVLKNENTELKKRIEILEHQVNKSEPF